MTQITVQIPDAVAAQVKAANLWLPTILELNFTHFQTRAATTGKQQVLEFLADNPSAEKVEKFSFSRYLQQRISRLLLLNNAGKADEAIKLELAEWGKLLHIATMLTLKAMSYRKGL